MADICSMCKTSYHRNSDDEFFLTDELPICSTCAEMLDSLMYGESVSAYRDARKYIEKLQGSTTNAEVHAVLHQILTNSPEPEEEPDDTYASPAPTHIEVPGTRAEQDFFSRFSFSAASGNDLPYVVYQVTLKEKLFGTGSGNLVELESVLNHFYGKGYRLHTMSTSNGGSKGGFGGDRIQATLVFEKADLFK